MPGQQHRRHEPDAADPGDDRENMNRARDDTPVDHRTPPPSYRYRAMDRVPAQRDGSDRSCLSVARSRLYQRNAIEYREQRERGAPCGAAADSSVCIASGSNGAAIRKAVQE